jgi:nitrate/nitrite-specific signal transduction histidine kinase
VGFFDSLKRFKNQIDEIESSVYSGKQSLLEVYERNLKLEAEIAVRTRELDTANRQMLTLQHILDMMTASKPLSAVLKAIANSLQGGLGYLHSCMIKYSREDDARYIEVVAHSDDDFSEKLVPT